MTLTLRAVSLNGQPLSQPITAHFDAQGGTIGRSDHSTMALPDPERHISRRQAQVSIGEFGYRIQNIGSANPITVRGRALVQGEISPLTHSDQVRIGGYLLEVIEEPESSEAGLITRGRAVVDARTSRPGGAAGAGLGDLSLPLPSGNPFADLLGTPAPVPPHRSPAAAPSTGAFYAPLGTAPAAAVPRPPDSAQPSSPATASAAATADAEVLWRHFCAGAGIALERPEGMTPELMRSIGALLRSATEGALEGVMHRFRPEQVEAKLDGAMVLDRLLPMNRKARLWDLYLAHFDAIRDEAQEDFHALFGKAFLAAYEQRREHPPQEKATDKTIDPRC